MEPHQAAPERRAGIFHTALVLLLFLGGCEKKAAPEPPVHNAFTDHIDQGITTMDKAQSLADQANAQAEQLNTQAQNVGETQ